MHELLNSRKDLSDDQISILISFYSKLMEDLNVKQKLSKSNWDFLTSNYLKISNLVRIGKLFSFENGKEIVDLKNFKEKNKKINELFEYSKELQSFLKFENMNELTDLFHFNISIFYFMYKVKPEELNETFNELKNSNSLNKNFKLSNSLYKNLKSKLSEFNKNFNNHLNNKDIGFIKEYSLFLKNNKLTYLFHLRKEYLSIIEVCDFHKRFFNDSFVLMHKHLQSISNEILERTSNKGSKNSPLILSKFKSLENQIYIKEKAIKRHIHSNVLKASEVESTIHKDLNPDLNVTPPLEDIPPEESVVPFKDSKLESTSESVSVEFDSNILILCHQNVKEILRTSEKPSFPDKTSIKHFENGEFYFLSLLNLINQFSRKSNEPLSSMEIANYVINCVICGTQAWEQYLSCGVPDEELTHNLSGLCTASGYSPHPRDLPFIMAANTAEISARNIPMLLNEYDPDNKDKFVKNLLVMAYLFSMNDPSIDLENLLKNCKEYCSRTMYGLIRVRQSFPNPLSKKQADAIEDNLNNSLSILKNINKNIKINNDFVVDPTFDNFLNNINEFYKTCDERIEN